MAAATDAAVTKYRSAVRAVYGVRRGKPIHCGSCFLIELDSNKYAITAAHVLAHLSDHPMMIGGDRRLVAILDPDTFHCTSVPKSNRAKQDHDDFAWLKLTERIVNELGPVRYICSNEFSRSRVNPDKRAYVLLGYPRSRNKKPHWKLRPKVLATFSMWRSAPELYAKLNLSGEDHLTIGFKRQAYDRLGSVINSTHPLGMSGGPLFDLGRVAHPSRLSGESVFPGVLVGMLIEYDEESEVVLCVRLESIVNEIRRH